MNFEEAYKNLIPNIDMYYKIQSKNTFKERFELRILPYFKNYNIEDVDIDSLNKWKEYILSFNYSFNYNRNLFYIFSRFLNLCVKYYGLEKNLLYDVGCFKNSDIVKHDFYTIIEFRRFIKGFDNIVYKIFFELLFYTGVRPGEAMALKFSDLQENCIYINKTINEHGKREINSPKTKSSIRYIKIDYKLKNSINRLKKYYINKYNFENDFYIFGGIKPLSPTTINRYKKEVCKKVGIRSIKLHEFRHSHATLLISKGMMINEVSRRLGHSNTSITLNTYTHTFEKQEKRVLRTLNFLRIFF